MRDLEIPTQNRNGTPERAKKWRGENHYKMIFKNCVELKKDTSFHTEGM